MTVQAFVVSPGIENSDWTPLCFRPGDPKRELWAYREACNLVAAKADELEPGEKVLVELREMTQADCDDCLSEDCALRLCSQSPRASIPKPHLRKLPFSEIRDIPKKQKSVVSR